MIDPPPVSTRDPQQRVDAVASPGDGAVEALVVRAGGRACALRLEEVVETLRPLPIEPVAGAPAFVRGAALLRGRATPVVRLATLLGAGDAAGARWVALRVGARRVALEVDEIIGLRRLAGEEVESAAPLLRGARAEHVEVLAALDGQLAAVIEAARLLPGEGAS